MKYVLIHGLGQKPSSWDNVIQNMPESFEVVCPDLFSLVISDEMNYPSLYRAFSSFHNTTQYPPKAGPTRAVSPRQGGKKQAKNKKQKTNSEHLF